MLWDNKNMIILGLVDPGSPLRAMSRAITSFTLAKWPPSNTSTQHTIDICAFLANYHMPWTFSVTCNNQNAIHKIFLCKHNLLYVCGFCELLEDKNYFIFVFYSHSNFNYAQQKKMPN